MRRESLGLGTHRWRPMVSNFELNGFSGSGNLSGCPSGNAGPGHETGSKQHRESLFSIRTLLLLWILLNLTSTGLKENLGFMR